MLDFLFRSEIWYLAAASLLPISAWLWFFQHQHRERKFFVFLTFLAGMFAVIPIKLYEKYWDTSVLYFEHINLFQYLADLAEFPDFPRLIAFVLVNALVAFGLYVFTAVMMAILEIISGENTLRVYEHKAKKIIESPLFFISVGVICGVLAYALSFSVAEKIWFFVVVGMLEEYVKHLVLRFTNEENVHSVKDALSFAVIVALGFAFVENIYYFQNFLGETPPTDIQFWAFFILRSTVSVTAHISFSGILAYFYGLAHFSKEIYQQEIKENRARLTRWAHRIIHLKGATLFHEEMMMEGMLLAMFLHAIFNSLLEFEYLTTMLLMLMGMFFFVLHLFQKRDPFVSFRSPSPLPIQREKKAPLPAGQGI